MTEDLKDKEQEPAKKKGFFKRLFGAKEESDASHPNAADMDQKSDETAFAPEAPGPDEKPVADESRGADGRSPAAPAPAPVADAAPAASAEIPAPPGADAAPPEKKGFFTRLKERLGKTKKNVVKKIRRAVALHATVDEELLEEIEDILIQADAGMETTVKIIDQLRARVEDEHIKDPQLIIPALKDIIRALLAEEERPFTLGTQRPYVVLVVGVNGTGKTTTIGKIAAHLRRDGRSVMMVAADTFRAAAIDQLQIWADRTGADLIRQHEGADAASVCYDGLQAAVNRGVDVVLIDTAGRLHTKVNLMKELGKVDKVIKKVIPDAPHETLLVVDATTGQNALNQALTFSETTPLSGLVMTKLDGTAKGGILLALRDRVKAPVYFIGVGEQVDDLRDFDAGEFVEALFSVEEGEDEEGE